MFLILAPDSSIFPWEAIHLARINPASIALASIAHATRPLSKRWHAGSLSSKIRTFMSESCIMKGNEFLKKLKALAERKDWPCEWHPDEGKGSHGTFYLNGRKTIVRNLKDELKTGTLYAMLKQLGIKESDLYK